MANDEVTGSGGLSERLRLPRPDRLAPSHPRFVAVVAAHEAAVLAGRTMYLDPITGLSVMTAASLLERGTCCDSGCRHCPFPATGSD